MFEKKLNEIGFFYSGLSGKSKEDFIGNYPDKYIDFVSVFKSSIELETLPSVRVNKDEKQNIVNQNDLIINVTSENIEEVGMCSLYTYETPVYLNSFCKGLRLYDGFDPYYVKYLLSSNKYRKLIIKEAQGVTRINLSTTRIGKIILDIHEPKLQKKIGCFFKEIDNLIELENRKVKLYKNTLNSYVNSKSLEFYKKHECIRLRNVINISNTRNKHQDKIVHTISGEKGIIHQSQVYQRSISSSDTSKYKVIKKDMFVYNKSFSKEYPCGTIKRMKNSEGCVSPLYIPFEVTDNNLLDFFEHFFESKIWQNELSKTIGKSARNQLSINDDQFKNLMVPKIDNNEISKFKQVTTTLNDLILLSEDKVKLLEQKKTYYLNKIFH